MEPRIQHVFNEHRAVYQEHKADRDGAPALEAHSLPRDPSHL